MSRESSKRMHKLFVLIFLGLVFRPCLAIVNGVDVEPGDPVAGYTVALQVEDAQADGTTEYHKCSGSLISSRLILTAGHCLWFLKDRTSVRVIFDVRPRWGADGAGQLRIKAKAVRVDPDFKMDSQGTYNDLAVVLLSTDAPPGYSPIGLADGTFSGAVAGDTIVVSGFGTDKETELLDAGRFRLRATRLEVAPLTVPSVLWADQSQSGFCFGDSGGPAVLQRDGKTFVAGVVIHLLYDDKGKGHCAGAGAKGAFTSVAHYEAWLAQAIAELSAI